MVNLGAMAKRPLCLPTADQGRNAVLGTNVTDIKILNTFASGIQLSRPTYVAGDVHGRADLLDRLMTKIDAHVAANAVNSPLLVMLGDYIDRGDDSSKILRWLHDISCQYPDNIVCLMGNHEQMMLDFLDNPTSSKRSWLRHGGLQTLASFGVPMAGFGEHPKESELLDMSAVLREKLGPIEPWLRQLPIFWRDNNLYAVHAGADPYVSIEEQSSRTLLWGHRNFGHAKRTDGCWVVHGHTAVEKASIRDRVVSIDTGAVYSGTLSAAFFSPDGAVEFIDTSSA